MLKGNLAVAACACFVLGCGSDAISTDRSEPHGVSADISDSLQPWVRAQYGEICEIRATLLPPATGVKNPVKDLIQLLEVDGVEYSGEAPLRLTYWDWFARDQVDSLEPGADFQATGYESLSMLGIPSGFATYDGGRFMNRIPQGTGFMTHHEFVVLSIP